jgi:hypothetical protein
VKQTRCTTCDSDHEYKHAKVPRQRKKGDTPAALYAQVAAAAPKRVAHDPSSSESDAESPVAEDPVEPSVAEAAETSAETMTERELSAAPLQDEEPFDEDENRPNEEGPAHRRLIRASLPRPEGQQPPARPIPEFTIRQPGGRPNRFRPRHGRGGGGGQQHFGNRSNGNFGGPVRGGGNHQRHHGGRKRSK